MNLGRCLLEIILVCLVPKQAKSGKLLPLIDLLAGNFPVAPARSTVLKTIWKACENVKGLFTNNCIISENNKISGERSILWNLHHKEKPLALLQGCSAKNWYFKGIKCFNDILCEGHLKSWTSLSHEFDLPHSNWRTYSVLREACIHLHLPMTCSNDKANLKKLKWSDGTVLQKINAKMT